MDINAIMAELAQYIRMQEEAAATVEHLKDQLKAQMQAAEARSNNPIFWDYTPAELAELAELHRAYMAEKSAAGL